MSGEGRKALLFVAGVAVLVALAAAFGMKVLGMAAGPDVEIVSALKETESSGLQLPLSVPDAPPLVLHRHFYERILVEPDLEARRADVSATLDAEGKVGATQVSSVGLERIPFRYDDGAWVPEKGWAPRLAGVVSALESRRRALEEGDVEALARLGQTDAAALREDEALKRLLSLRKRKVHAEGWYLRFERDEILVTEDFRVQGDTPDRPVDVRGKKRLHLRQQSGEFFFEPGLI